MQKILLLKAEQGLKRLTLVYTFLEVDRNRTRLFCAESATYSLNLIVTFT